MEACKPPKRFRWHRWVLGLAVAFVFMSVFLVRGQAYLLVGKHLLLGWVDSLRINWLGLTLSPPHLILALVMALAAVFGLHRLAVAWRKRLRPDAGRWRVRWSLGLVGMLLASATAAIAFAGVAHQVAWMKGEQWVESSKYRDRAFVVALDLSRQLRGYAANHVDGRYPDELNEVEWVNGSLAGYSPDRLLLFRDTHLSTPEPWLYFGKGLTIQSPPGLLLVAAPRSRLGKRWVVMTPGEVDQIEESDYQSLIQPSLTATVP